ncbi:hypothetical protein CTAYLR_006098 [Chrysophaeum taylorii]|uniref:Sugar phosphate transporter domain-containing protein n=1 Tax=Chrysophaeum taylorii TaxID=2483200 RepID=A0AAD7XLU3_9STRA|nr:hypothetical protein CTAYLR_006098 [Chrysophaeum taylorii]
MAAERFVSSSAGAASQELEDSSPILKAKAVEAKRRPIAAFVDAFAAVLSCGMYATCSIMMVLTNKWLASSFNVHAHVSLLLMQNLIATCLVVLCKASGVVAYADFDRKTALAWCPVNVCFVLMLLTSFVAMRYLSVPMITVFKQLANLITAVGEYHFFGKRVGAGVVVSFAIMILGATLASAKDIGFSALGYTWQIANCFATSGYVLYLKHATRSIQLSKFGMVFYNNVLSVPFLLFLAVANGEPATLHARKSVLDLTFLGMNAIAGCVGFALNVASVWCIASTSATTYAVVGALNKIPVTILGFYLFEAPVSKEAAIYIALSLIGGFVYSYEKLRR